MRERVSILMVAAGQTDEAEFQQALDSVAGQSIPSNRTELIVAGVLGRTDLGDRIRAVVPIATDREGTILNEAMAHVDGDLVAITDTVTQWDPEKLARQLDALESDPEADVCVHPVTGGGPVELATRWTAFGALTTLFLERPWPLGATLMRRRALEKLDRYREIPLADWEMAMRMVLAGRRFLVLAEPLAHRLRPAEATLSTLSPAQGRYSFIKEHLEDLGVKDLFRHTTLKSVPDGYAFKAGLYNIHDYIDDACATVDRALMIGESASASYWQAALYRRRTKYKDSRALFGAVDEQPFYEDLYAATTRLLAEAGDNPDAAPFGERLAGAGRWAPAAFVDWCQRLQFGNGSPEALRLAERIQQAEADLLLRATYRAAVKDEADGGSDQ